MKGLQKYLTPFAPDQSGAVSVLYEFGGLLVICDAGGCVGNICGFDEPRWSTAKSAIFSAGLRDMDAIMGRDEHLVKKLVMAVDEIDANFVAVIGTPVPAVIGTDYVALSRMIEKKVDIPVIALSTTGMSFYDKGAQAAYLAIVKEFCREKLPVKKGYIGVFGATPLELGDLQAKEKMQSVIDRDGIKNENEDGTELSEGETSYKVYCYGMGDGLVQLERASEAEFNLVLAPSGLKAAQYLKDTFGTPYEIYNPLVKEYIPGIPFENKRVLIIGQQIFAHSLRKELRKQGCKDVIAADFFMQIPELTETGDVHLSDEDQCEELLQKGAFDVIFADAVFKKMARNFAGVFVEIPQFAVSGKLVGE